MSQLPEINLTPKDTQVLVQNVAELTADLPFPNGYSIAVIVLSAAHVLVSLIMVILASSAIKTPFVLRSRFAWMLSLVVSVGILIVSILEFLKIKKLNDATRSVQKQINDLPGFTLYL